MYIYEIIVTWSYNKRNRKEQETNDYRIFIDLQIWEFSLNIYISRLIIFNITYTSRTQPKIYIEDVHPYYDCDLLFPQPNHLLIPDSVYSNTLLGCRHVERNLRKKDALKQSFFFFFSPEIAVRFIDGNKRLRNARPKADGSTASDVIFTITFACVRSTWTRITRTKTSRTTSRSFENGARCVHNTDAPMISETLQGRRDRPTLDFICTPHMHTYAYVLWPIHKHVHALAASRLYHHRGKVTLYRGDIVLGRSYCP